MIARFVGGCWYADVVALSNDRIDTAPHTSVRAEMIGESGCWKQSPARIGQGWGTRCNLAPMSNWDRGERVAGGGVRVPSRQ